MAVKLGDLRVGRLLGGWLTGRFENAGRRLHYVPVGMNTALCGIAPGARSRGWLMDYDRPATCARCRRKGAKRAATA